MDDQLNNCLSDQTTHVVVEFVHEKTVNKACIELVPRWWLDRVEEKWFCYYPPKKDWPKVNFWTRTSKCRDRLWKGSEICILKEAANYEQGLRRLKKFYTDDVVLSTGDDAREETDTRNNNVDMFSVAESQMELQNLPPMIPKNSVARKSGDETIRQSLSKVTKTPTDPSNSTEKRMRRDNRNGINNTVDHTKDNTEDNTEDNDEDNTEDNTEDNDEDNTEDNPEETDMLAVAVGNAVGATDLDKFLTTVISQIQLSEKQIIRALDGAKRSILYDAQLRADEVKNTVVLNSVSSLSPDISEHMERLGFELPFKDVKDFEAFDAVVAGDGEKRKSLECIMIKFTVGNKEFTAALSIILSSLLGKELQLQYSACGREIRGKKKKSFSTTETFKCLDAVLTEKYSISTKTIISKMSRWFIGASDRAGGRKQRK